MSRSLFGEGYRNDGDISILVAVPILIVHNITLVSPQRCQILPIFQRLKQGVKNISCLSFWPSYFPSQLFYLGLQW